MEKCSRHAARIPQTVRSKHAMEPRNTLRGTRNTRRNPEKRFGDNRKHVVGVLGNTLRCPLNMLRGTRETHADCHGGAKEENSEDSPESKHELTLLPNLLSKKKTRPVFRPKKSPFQFQLWEILNIRLPFSHSAV